MNEVMKGLRSRSVERVAGSGNKFVHLTENQSDYYMNFVPGFKNWDMCGSEAILSARFGIVTDAKKRAIEYCPESSYTLQGGIIAAKNKNVFDFCEERIQASTGISLEMNQHMIATEADEHKRRLRLKQQLTQPQPVESSTGLYPSESMSSTT